MKKPFDLRPVTTPLVVTMEPSKGDAVPLPWIAAIVWVTLHGGIGLTASVKSLVAVASALSVTWIVNPYGEPLSSVGAPASVAPVSVRPGGSVPPVCAKTYPVPEPPLAANVCEYGCRTVPAGSGETVTIASGVGPPLQTFVGLAVLRGVGAPVAKSAPLLLVSVQPAPARIAAVVLERVAVGPAPS